MKQRFLQLSALFTSLLLLAASIGEAQWMKVGPPAGPGFNVFAMRVMGTDLYAGGIGIAKWDGTNWTNMGRVAPSYTAGLGYIGINSMVVYHNELYVGGDIDSVGGVYIDHTIGVAKWNGATWEKVGSTVHDLAGVKHMVVYNDELYACGTKGINRWNGTTWTNVATNAATCMAVYHNDLYVGGGFNSMGGAAMSVGLGFAKFDGNSWTALTGFYDTLAALPGINAASIASMMVFKDELYAIGALDYAGSTYVRGAAKWNGTSWNTTNGGMTGNGSFMVNCMSIDSNALYVVGPIQKVNSTNDSIYLSTYWDGTKWHQMFGSDAAYTSFVTTVNYKGEIYTSYNGFAKWTGVVSAVPGLEEVTSLANLYPNPSNGIVHLSLNYKEPIQIRVTNALGVCVYQQQLSHPDTQHTIDLSSATTGIYFIEFVTASRTDLKRVLIQK